MSRNKRMGVEICNPDNHNYITICLERLGQKIEMIRECSFLSKIVPMHVTSQLFSLYKSV